MCIYIHTHTYIYIYIYSYRLPVSCLACEKFRSVHSVLTTCKKLNKLKNQQLFLALSQK